jgi:hypothetical protein
MVIEDNNSPALIMIRTAEDVESPAIVMKGISINCIVFEGTHFIGIVLSDMGQTLASVCLLNPEDVDAMVRILLEAKTHFLGSPSSDTIN